MSLDWKTKLIQVWPYASTVTTVMFLCVACVGAFLTWQSGAQGTMSFMLAIVDPSMAAIVLLIVAIVLPDVFRGSQFRLPHVVSLPTLYLALVFGTKVIAQGSFSSLLRVEGAARVDLMWLQPKALILSFVVTVAILAGIGALFVQKDDVK